MTSGTTLAGKKQEEEQPQPPEPPDGLKNNWLIKRLTQSEHDENDPLKDPIKAFGELKEDKYKAELQLVDRYQSFVAELLRLSLLGIAVFGYLYTKQLFEGLPAWGESVAKGFAISSIIMFGISAAFALAFRFFAAEGATKYIEALRLLRFHPDIDKAQNSLTAQDSLEARMKKIHWARATKLLSAVTLGIGGFLVAACIITLLFGSTPSTSTTPEQQKKELDELSESGAISPEEFEDMKERVDIKQADELNKTGIITDAEFEDMKERILARQ